MARTNNLTDFLTDVASAIKTKKGDDTAISAANFDIEIANLPVQGIYQHKSVTISANGTSTIEPDQGYDAIDQMTITVQVPVAKLQTKTYQFTQNTSIQLLPDSGYNGFDQINLDINVPAEGTQGFSSIADMEASSPNVGDYAYVYNTEMEGLYQYQTISGVVAIPHKSAIDTSTNPVTYTPSIDDVYVDHDKLVAVINKLVNDYAFTYPMLFRPQSLTTISVTVIDNKLYAVLTNGSNYYREAKNGYSGSTVVTDFYCGMAQMTSNPKLILWELDLDNTTYQQPIELNFSGYSGNVYYYHFTNMVCNHCVVFVTTGGAVKLPTTFYNTSDYKSKSTETVSIPTGTINKWVLQENSKYLDTSDATVTANDINNGKVAYANGNRIVGVSNVFNQMTDVKRYNTKAELDAVYDAPLGTKGVVYGGKTMFPATNGTPLLNLYAPPEIVVDKAITSTHSYEIDITYKDGGGSGSSRSITPTSFIINLWCNGSTRSEIRIPYTSEDGITYTRGAITNTGFHFDDTTNIITWNSTNIESVVFSNMDDVCGKFLKSFISTLGGIYEFKNYTEKTGVTYARRLSDVLQDPAAISQQTYNCFLYGERKSSYGLVVLGDIQRYKSIENCVVITTGYQTQYTNDHILYDDTKNKYYLGYVSTATAELNDTVQRSLTVYKYGPEGNTSPKISYTINDLEYKTKYDDTHVRYFLPFLEIPDPTQAYIIATNVVKMYDKTLADMGTDITYVTGNNYLTVNSYVPCETQMTVTSNSDLLPGKIAIGADGETFVGDKTVFDAIEPKSVFENFYNTQRIRSSTQYNGYNFHDVASVPSLNKLYYVKTANDLSLFNDGYVGTIDNCVSLYVDQTELVKYGSYTTLSLIGCSIKYNYIVTIQRDGSYNGRIIIYDYTTREIIYSSDEFHIYTNYTSYEVKFINEDFVMVVSSNPTADSSIRILDLRDLSLKTILNLSGDYYIPEYAVTFGEDYVVYGYHTNDSGDTHDWYAYLYNCKTKEDPQLLMSSTNNSQTYNDTHIAGDSTYLYIATSIGVVKYDKNTKTIIYTEPVKWNLTYRDTRYMEQSDTLTDFFDSYSAIDKATGTTFKRVAIELLDSSNNVIASTKTDTYSSENPVYEKDGKYYAIIDGILGIGTLEITEPVNGKLFTIKCEKIYHAPYLIYQQNNGSILTYSFSKYILPSQLTFNSDGSVSYHVRLVNLHLDLTLKEYMVSTPSDYEYVVIGNTLSSSKSGYASGNIVLQPIPGATQNNGGGE